MSIHDIFQGFSGKTLAARKIVESHTVRHTENLENEFKRFLMPI